VLRNKLKKELRNTLHFGKPRAGKNYVILKKERKILRSYDYIIKILKMALFINRRAKSV